jgi:putative nucleotidyltransferase with HDIG domain
METNRKSRVYQGAITAAGLSVWLVSFVEVVAGYEPKDQLELLLIVPVIVAVGMSPLHFRLPLQLGFSREKVGFTLSDAIVVMAASWYGFSAAVFLAGIEGFTSSRRIVNRTSSNLFSSGMMSLGAAAAAASLNATLHFGFGLSAPARNTTLLAVAVSMLAANLAQMAVNITLLTMLLALRQGEPLRRQWKGCMVASVLFLPTSSTATLMYIALQYNFWLMLVIGGPIFITLHLWLRVYRDNVQKRISAVEKAHRETIEALAVAINAKDEVTHEHVLRVQVYAAGVARLLGCSESEIEALKSGALLHDIGKIAVPDYILEKPGKLTAAEFEKMKIHTIAGAQIIGRVEFPYPIVPIVRHHHERWDGRGYPDGLSGEEIPLTARILSVVDCFDAVREDRQYRKGLSREEAIALILEGSGSQYDPKVVSMFIAYLTEFEAEIERSRHLPPPSFGIEPIEQLSESARMVPPAAGLAEEYRGDRLAKDSMRAMCDLAQAVISAEKRESKLSAFADKLKAMVDYDTCAITLVTPETGQNEVAHATGQHAERIKGRRIALGEGVTGWVIANKKPFCNTDPKLDLPPQLADCFSSYKTLTVFPILFDQAIYGAVTLYSATINHYDAEHQESLEEATAIMAAALSSDEQIAAIWPQSIADRSLMKRKAIDVDVESEIPS